MLFFALASAWRTSGRAGAQELEPRAYSPSPIGTTFVIGGIGRSQGAILLDPSLDVDNVQGDLWVATLGAGRVFDLAGRQARILAVFPLAWGAITGDVGQQHERQNLAFPGTAHREQDPVVAWQAHISYALPRRTWLAFNGTWFAGGETRVERVASADEQRNSRLGLTFSVPASSTQSIKFIYSTGATTRRGNDFNTFNVTWQRVWF